MALTTESAARKDRTTGKGAELQHRHFAFIAATIADIQAAGARKQMAEHFADACQHSNPHFDRARFLAACKI